MRENLEEIRQTYQDALEDAVLMDCDEHQFRSVLAEMASALKPPLPASRVVLTVNGRILPTQIP